MGLLQYLINEGKREVMIDKIGIPERMADWIVANIEKKFQIWFANYLKILRQEYPDSIAHDMDNWFRFDPSYEPEESANLAEIFKNPYATAIIQAVNFLMDIVKDPEMPTMDLREFSGPLAVYDALNDYPTVRDYIEATNTNIQGMTWDEAVIQADEWHQRIAQGESVGSTIELQGDMEVIHQFDDGYYWVDVHDNNCNIEGRAMGHCGNTRADTLLSLRSPDGEPHITVAWDYDGTYRQAKGKGNKKPVEKYHKYMEWLFTNGGDYQIQHYRPEYKSSEDFTIGDLPEQLQDEILKKYPTIDPTYTIRKILEDASLTDVQKFEKLKKYDEESDFFDGQLDDFELNDEGRLIVAKDVDMIEFKRKDDHSMEWVFNVLTGEDHLFFEGYEGDDYIDDIDFERYPYESKQIQYLLNLAKEEDPDKYQEVIDEMQEDFDEPYEEVIKNDSRYLEDFLEKLYEEDFDDFKMSLDRVATWSAESQATDDMYKDLIKFFKEADFENAYGAELNDIDWVLEYENDNDLLQGDGAVNITISINDLLKPITEAPDFIEDNYLSDFFKPYQFTSKLQTPHYGYPSSGIERELYNDVFDYAIYE